MTEEDLEKLRTSNARIDEALALAADQQGKVEGHLGEITKLVREINDLLETIEPSNFLSKTTTATEVQQAPINPGHTYGSTTSG
jgi:hypothetical protein